MKDIVFVPGVWDMLHFGHIKFLERASKFANDNGITIVGVESDELVLEEKGNLPIVSLKDRILAIEGLRYVDIAIPFYDFDYVSYIQQYNVDILILSDVNKNSDKKRFKDAIDYMLYKNGKVIYLPYNTDISSAKIKERILESSNPWKPVWDKVGKDDNIDDTKVVSDALTEDKVKTLAGYITNKLRIKSSDTVLDFGCGSAVTLKNIDCKRFGIDISEGMIERAMKNCPDGTFLVENHIPFRNRFDRIICYGVLHYLPSLDHVSNIIEEMKSISRNIMIMEIPDMAKRELRERHRNTIGKAKYPKQLYFDKQFFVDRGFGVFNNEISLTNSSDYGFTALYGDNEENLKEALFAFKELMDQHGIKFTLEGGTLLGAYRDKRLLPWDEDIDIGIVVDSYDDFANMNIFRLLRDAQKKGFKDARWAHEFVIDRQYLKYPDIALLPEDEQWKEFLKIDPKWRQERFGMYWHSGNSTVGTLLSADGMVRIDCTISLKGVHDSYDYFYSNDNGKQKFEEIVLYDKMFYIPPCPLRYISKYYGDTWMNTFCSNSLWIKHKKLLLEGQIPQEVEDFMKRWKHLLKNK